MNARGDQEVPCGEGTLSREYPSLEDVVARLNKLTSGRHASHCLSEERKRRVRTHFERLGSRSDAVGAFLSALSDIKALPALVRRTAEARALLDAVARDPSLCTPPMTAADRHEIRRLAEIEGATLKIYEEKLSGARATVADYVAGGMPSGGAPAHSDFATADLWVDAILKASTDRITRTEIQLFRRVGTGRYSGQ